MNRASAFLGLGLALGLAFALGNIGCASQGQGPASSRTTYSITKKAGEHLHRVGELAAKKDWDGAINELDHMADSKYLNATERATMLYMRAGILIAQNKTDESLKTAEEAVALDALPDEQQLDLMYNVAQGYFMAERFGDSADMFGKWTKLAPKVDPTQNYVIASAYAQAHRFDEALPFAQKAVDEMPAPPKEGWLQLLLSLQFELHHESEVAAALERLVKAFPKAEYSLQLAATYEELGDSAKASKALEGAYAAGMITEEKDLVTMARLYLQTGKAREAAALLDKHMQDGKVGKSGENLQLRAACWIGAKDPAKAEAALKAAGEGASGELYFELARMYAEKNDWEKARDAAASAMTKGGLESAGENRLLLGIAHYNTKRKDAALNAFAEAKKNPVTAECADQWTKLVKAGKSGAPSGCGLADLAPPRAGAKTQTAAAK